MGRRSRDAYGHHACVASMFAFFMSARRLWAVVLVLDRVQSFDAYKLRYRHAGQR
jgi:hypothetical protein